jgi:hypothetical protein
MASHIFILTRNSILPKLSSSSIRVLNSLKDPSTYKTITTVSLEMVFIIHLLPYYVYLDISCDLLRVVVEWYSGRVVPSRSSSNYVNSVWFLLLCRIFESQSWLKPVTKTKASCEATRCFLLLVNITSYM